MLTVTPPHTPTKKPPRNLYKMAPRHTECHQLTNFDILLFGNIEQRGGKLIRPIGQARANFALTMMAACYTLKRRVYFQKAGVKTF